MIELQQLTKRYGDKLAVDGISATIRPGVVTGFLGPNGAGKSTTMRMILGLDRPTSGAALVNGRPYVDAPAPLAEVGALLDAKAVDGGRSARNHLLALGATVGIGPRRVDEVLASVGLTEVAHQLRRLVLAGHGPAPGHRRGAAGRPGRADPRRARQRPRPRRHPVDPCPAHRTGPAGTHGAAVLALDERDAAGRRSPADHRPGPHPRRHLDGRLHRALRRRRRRRGVSGRRRAGAPAGRRRRDPDVHGTRPVRGPRPHGGRDRRHRRRTRAPPPRAGPDRGLARVRLPRAHPRQRRIRRPPSDPTSHPPTNSTRAAS